MSTLRIVSLAIHSYALLLHFIVTVHFYQVDVLLFFDVETTNAMIGENQQLVTDEPVEFEK